MKLVIANKCYSSWSMRPWLLMRAKGIPFIEVLVPFHTPEFNAAVIERAGGGAGKVPTLADDGTIVWESLAIMEYLAERFPDAGIWPKDATARAHARAAASEMHAGFRALRSACSMNLGKVFAARDRGAEVDRDVVRITALWREARQRFGGDGAFLYGAFSAADAMFAPVATRLASYSIAVDGISQAYMNALFALPAFVEWRQAALAERWLVPEDEVDEPVVIDLRRDLNIAPKAY
jgi:glutathione S-transferase